MSPGDKVIVTYGDPGELPLTARVQSFPEKKLCFLEFVDVDGNGDFEELPGSPHFTSVHAGQAQRIDVILPSVVTPGDTSHIKVAYTDRFKARPEPTTLVDALQWGLLGIEGSQHEAPFNCQMDSVRLEAKDLAKTNCKDSNLRVYVRDCQQGLEATSNPALVRPKGLKLFWGDLHGQSQYHGWNPEEQVGISCNTPEECYRYARDIAGLDFCAITDTGGITKQGWQETVQTALGMNEPGRFVAFQGSEVGDNKHGHRNLVFSGDKAEPGICPGRAGARKDHLETLETANIQKRYDERDDVILIPHHTKMWADWNCYNAKLEPVMEIYSIWGSGEKRGTDLWDLREMTGGAQEAWARGYKIGVIAGSDTHAGMPGRSLPDGDRDNFLRYPAGIAGVWAPELTRKAIFGAIKSRRCYGTTGVRIILETFIDDNPMGSDVRWPAKDKARKFCINVWGTDKLGTVTVVKNNEDVQTFRPESEEVELVYEDKSQAGVNDYYYVRVIQQDGNRAWSSPIWLV